ncbi:tRNA1(Val) A37 N6-methylase TrmN6 [Celeribacter baekdonensis]|uniref:tRNA1(Val) A37 N6-methylase TrmN6 n=1 Tax=Celeribacter baekdonensis TaxID=875171 RepID=A0A1G7M851_9RHOB|nr:methyltransferase [Celeribacter baekdonensis]SDF57814.1 tRNA1(Val) A37 N6-methylase TrmN6 [Celeribacter baekdonensis]
MNSEATETCDAFLGGRVQLYQPADGYRAGVDPVLLAAATPAQPGQTVLELGCGAGAASLCLHARVTGLSLTGVEMQPLYADLARRNAVLNGADMRIVDADLRHLPSDIKARGFDHVIANPPYYDRARSTSSINAGRDMALAGDTPLSDWIDVAAKRLAPKGYLTMIQKADRLPDILTPLMARLGSVRVRAIQPRVGRLAELVIVQARKGGRAAFVMEPPLILHEGERHLRDGESYTAQVLTILREGGDLPWGH